MKFFFIFLKNTVLKLFSHSVFGNKPHLSERGKTATLRNYTQSEILSTMDLDLLEDLYLHQRINFMCLTDCYVSPPSLLCNLLKTWTLQFPFLWRGCNTVYYDLFVYDPTLDFKLMFIFQWYSFFRSNKSKNTKSMFQLEGPSLRHLPAGAAVLSAQGYLNTCLYL